MSYLIKDTTKEERKKIVNKALAIQICVKLHNKLFPDEIKTTLTDYEKELVKELTDKEFV